MESLYTGDSFFTLSVWARIGLVLISSVLVLVAVVAARALFASLRRPVFCVLAGFAVFWGFVWLAPQAHYLYYMTIFEGLPVQWVIDWPPAPGYLIGLLSFSERHSLSHHSQGALGWAFILAGLAWPWFPPLRRQKSHRSR